MKNNRIITVAVLVGVVIAAVTVLGAARMSGEDGSSSKDSQKILGAVKAGSKGVVVFGNIDIDNGIGLMPLYPEGFPQPCKVKKVLAIEGQKVVKGQKLVEFDTELADLTVAEAKAAQEQAEAAIKRGDAAVHMAEQTMQAHQIAIQVMEKTVLSKTLEWEAAQKELDEKQRLGDIVNAGKVDIEIARKKLDAALKTLDAEKVKLEGMKAITPISKKEEALAGLAEAKAAVAKQKAMLEKAMFGLRQMTLTAPDDGKIVRNLVTEGLAFGPQTRQPAFWFQPKGTLIVRAEVDQEFASRVAAGQAAVIHDDGNSNLKWTGKVIRISDAFMPKRSGAMSPEGLLLNDTRVLECIVSIENNDNFPVRVGQRVKVSIGVE
jgi:multidrug resistance efflux pump